MKWLLGTYTMRFNRRHKLSGHLFAGRYKSLLIDGATPGYLRTVCDYVHLNPVRARLVGRRERLQKYRWSSYPSYLRSRKKRESWLRCDRLFGEHGLTKESRRSRLEFARRMEQRCVEPNDPNAEQIRRGWSFGAEDFIARLLDRLPGSVTEHHHGRERNQTDEQRADAMIAARSVSAATDGVSHVMRQMQKMKHAISLRKRRRRSRPACASTPQTAESNLATYSISAVILPPTSFNVTVSTPASFTLSKVTES